MTKMRFTKTLLSMAAALLSLGVCKADTLLYSAALSGSDVVPSTFSPATGTETVLLSGDFLTVHLDFQGFGSAVVGADIHCCSDMQSASSSVLTFSEFPIQTNGSYEYTFFLPTDLSGITETAFLNGLQSNLSYTQIDSRIYPNGAIRGKLAPITLAPEPSSLLLLCTGAFPAFRLVMRHRFRRAVREAQQ